MNDHNSIVSLVQRCVVFGREGPWDDLLTPLESMINRKAPLNQSVEIRHWLLGWLIEGQRLESALTWLLEENVRGEFPSMYEQDRALTNYLARVVESGVGAFFREQRGTRSRLRVKHLEEGHHAQLLARPDRISADAQGLIKDIRQFLVQLQPDEYVPFWLRYYNALGPLRTESLEWIGQKCSSSIDDVLERIETEVQEHQKQPGFPINAKFIAQLLGTSPQAIDQRISRVRTLLRKHFNDEGQCE